jgi:hypothetical protein
MRRNMHLNSAPVHTSVFENLDSPDCERLGGSPFCACTAACDDGTIKMYRSYVRPKQHRNARLIFQTTTC